MFSKKEEEERERDKEESCLRVFFFFKEESTCSLEPSFGYFRKIFLGKLLPPERKSPSF